MTHFGEHSGNNSTCTMETSESNCRKFTPHRPAQIFFFLDGQCFTVNFCELDPHCFGNEVAELLRATLALDAQNLRNYNSSLNCIVSQGSPGARHLS